MKKTPKDDAVESLAAALRLLEVLKNGSSPRALGALRASKYTLIPRPYAYSKSTPWQVVVPKHVTGEKRIRKYFKTREDAEQYIGNLSVLGDYRLADWR